MNGENQPLVTDEPVEFEKQLVEVSILQENILEKSRKYIPNLIKTNRKMSTCNELDLETLGS